VGSDGAVRDTDVAVGSATIGGGCDGVPCADAAPEGADPRHTRLMVQVENEITLWQRADYAPEAVKLFEGGAGGAGDGAAQVPGRGRSLWRGGREYVSDLVDCAYVEQWRRRARQSIAAAVPEPLAERPFADAGAGGCMDAMTDHVLDIWKATAPHRCDRSGYYMSQYAQYEKVLSAYARKDNALFVPESGTRRRIRVPLSGAGHGRLAGRRLG